MTELAAQRAELQSDAWLSTSSGFTWPSVGRISQTYGCTGFRLNPPRGSCRHFHDGLDIVSGLGSRVATAADGVVAYAGWNPWDERGRAWLMVVSHPDGFVTRYGHLLPGPIARVGQFVRQGQAIGRMGNTGRSTGTHLHFELLRGGSTVNPWTYLPAGMVTVKEPRRGDRHDPHKGHSRRGDHKRPDRDRADRQAGRSEADAWAGLIEEGQAALAVTSTSFSQSALDGEAHLCQSLLPAGEGPDSAGAASDPLPGSGPDGSAASPLDPADPCATLAEGSGTSSPSSDLLLSGSGPVRRPAAGPAGPLRTAVGVPRSLRGTSPVPV
jgi:hypothetical protein